MTPETQVETDTSALKQRADVLLEMRRPLEALKLLQTVIDADLEDEEAWCQAARAFSQLEDHERAVRAADWAIRAHPYHTDGHVWKCRCLLDQEQKKAALEAARQGVELTHDDPQMRRLLVRALLACGQQHEGSAVLAALSREFLKDPELTCLHGELYLSQKNLPLAESTFQNALEQDPASSTAWAGLGLVRKQQGRVRDAAKCYYQAARHDPSCTDHRRRAVELIDEQLGARGDNLASAYWTVGIFGGLILAFIFPLLLVPLIAALVWGNHVLHEHLLRSVLAWFPPEMDAFYRTAKPIQKREDAGYLRWGCGCVLVVAAIGVALVQITQRGLWEEAGQITVVSALAGPWIWSKIAPRRASRQTEAVAFRFPDDPAPDGTEQPVISERETDPHEIGWGQLMTGTPRAARKTARQLLAGDPDDLSALRLMALSSLAVGKPDEAVAAARYARSLDPEDSISCGVVWLVLGATGGADEAEAEAAEEPDVVEDCRDSYAEFVGALRGAGAVDAVRAGTQLLTRIAPDSAEAWALEADQACADERWSEAEAGYRQALTRKPNSGLYLTNLGFAEWRQRRRGAAIRWWNQALQVDPTCEQALSNLESLVRSTTLYLTTGFSVVLAGFAVLPTLAGLSHNPRMAWATFAGGPLLALLSLVSSFLIRRRISPLAARALPPDGTDGWVTTVFLNGAVSLSLLLCVHALQAWLEIAMHPQLWARRASGAATVTFLAVYIGVSVWRLLRPVRKSEEEKVEPDDVDPD